MSDRVQFRRDTKKHWEEANPILLEGEVAFELDTTRYKLGDGIHKYTELRYRSFDGEVTIGMLDDQIMQLIKNSGEKTINNMPDGEDLSLKTVNGISMIKLADKEYSPINDSGLGRVYVRKGDIIKQITKPNTIYIIQYDHNLNGQTLNIPEGCTLDFQGGSFSNGTIVGNNIYINSEKNRCIFNNVKTNIYSNNICEFIDNVNVKVLQNNKLFNVLTNKVCKINDIVNIRHCAYIREITEQIEDNGIYKANFSTPVIVSENNKYYYDATIYRGLDSNENLVCDDVVQNVTFYYIQYDIPKISYMSIKNEIIYPQWFGAIGDGINDDSKAINQSLEIAKINNNTVFLILGKYRISSTLIFSYKTTFKMSCSDAYDEDNSLAVDCDIAAAIIGKHNTTYAINIEHFHTIPYNNDRNSNYIGIEVQCVSHGCTIKKPYFLNPDVGIKFIAAGPTQAVRVEEFQCYKGNIGIQVERIIKQGTGYFNANYIRINWSTANRFFVSNTGNGNTIEGGSGEIAGDPAIDIVDNYCLMIKGILWNEFQYFCNIVRSNVFINEEVYSMGVINATDDSYCDIKPSLFDQNTISIQELKIPNIFYRLVFDDETKCLVDTMTNKIKSSSIDNYKYINGQVYSCISNLNITLEKPINLKNKLVIFKLSGIRNLIESETHHLNLIYFIDENDKLITGFRFNNWLEYCNSLREAKTNTMLSRICRGVTKLMFYINKNGELIYHNNNKIDISLEDRLVKTIQFRNQGTFYISDLLILETEEREDFYLTDFLKIKNSEFTTQISNYVVDNIRPSNPKIGFKCFDTNLNKPIYWTGSNWVDATGATV